MPISWPEAPHYGQVPMLPVGTATPECQFIHGPGTVRSAEDNPRITCEKSRSAWKGRCPVPRDVGSYVLLQASHLLVPLILVRTDGGLPEALH